MVNNYIISIPFIFKIYINIFQIVNMNPKVIPIVLTVSVHILCLPTVLANAILEAANSFSNSCFNCSKFCLSLLIGIGYFQGF